MSIIDRIVQALALVFLIVWAFYLAEGLVRRH